MADEINFVDGVYFNEPHKNAPDWVIGKLVVNGEKFVPWLRANFKEADDKGYITLKINMSKAGNPYVALDDFKPDPNYKKQQQSAPPNTDGFDDDIPF